MSNITNQIKADETLDCQGLSCPMPVVKTKKAMENLEPGQVLEVIATDKGSLADIKGWANSTGHDYLGSLDEEGVLKHYIRKSNPDEVKEEKKYPHTISNDELQAKIDDPNAIILDVREEAEYAFGHIPGAVNYSFGELEQHIDELDKDKEIYVVCRTGNRSDMACQLLSDKGFKNLKNVLPGMSQWNGPIEK
ncbi:MAG: sulfurtransferase TusA family protein [Bacillaceae bacterium]|nr:sulfurtransferase TusA family protein [Bacillaceae bacterium]